MFSPIAERRLFQIVVRIAAIVPVTAGGAGMLAGPKMIGASIQITRDLGSHFRYLSGLLLGIGLIFLWAVARIDQRGQMFRALGLIVMVGGLGRVLGVIEQGLPGTPHRLALVMELGVVPGLVFWLGRIERRVGARAEGF